MFNMSLKSLKHIKDIRFSNKRKEPYVFCMRIYKHNKVVKTVIRKHKGVPKNH